MPHCRFNHAVRQGGHPLDVDLAKLAAGDALLEKGSNLGEVPDDALRSLDTIARHLAERPTYLLPSHDPEAVSRFARGEITAAPIARVVDDASQ